MFVTHKRAMVSGMMMWLGGVILGVTGASLMHEPRVSLEQMVEEIADLPKSKYPVIVKIVDLEEDAYGTCDLEDELYIILIDDGCSADLASFILVHEVAHTLAWDAELEKGNHCAEWGEAYARCYLAMFPEEG